MKLPALVTWHMDKPLCSVAPATRPQARGLLFSIYAVDAREDTFTQPLTAKSLLRPKEDTRPKSKCVCTLTYTE